MALPYSKLDIDPEALLMALLEQSGIGGRGINQMGQSLTRPQMGPRANIDPSAIQALAQLMSSGGTPNMGPRLPQSPPNMGPQMPPQSPFKYTGPEEYADIQGSPEPVRPRAPMRRPMMSPRMSPPNMGPQMPQQRRPFDPNAAEQGSTFRDEMQAKMPMHETERARMYRSQLNRPKQRQPGGGGFDELSRFLLGPGPTSF